MTFTKKLARDDASLRNGHHSQAHNDSRPTYAGELVLVRELCQALAAEKINYCHWKSNTALDRSARGDNDLDLLISRRDGAAFTAILYRLGFKETRVAADKELPGVLDYYGYEAAADKLIHVHVHYQLVLGHDTTKNCRLPLEEAYLATAQQQGLFRVPEPAFELLVFVIRMVLKHSTWDALLGFEGKLSKSEQSELVDLTTRADQSRLYALLQQHLPYVDRELFAACLASFQTPHTPWQRFQLGRRLQQALRGHIRQPFLAALWLKVWRRVNWGVRRKILRQPNRRRLTVGGAIIAFVGGDGSGKSTAVDATYGWLAKTFAVSKIHLGKPTWSLSSFVVKSILKIGRLLGLLDTNQSADLGGERSGERAFPGYGWLLWHVLTARDRYHTYLAARRLASNGSIVICDRFPLPQIKAMDGQRAGWLITAPQSSRLVKYLAQLEATYYQQMMLPDVTVILRVDPDIAVARRPDEEATWVRHRNQEIWQLDWQQLPVHVVDASQPKETVTAQIKALIWSKI